jgi:valyl-tRNA synthetase
MSHELAKAYDPSQIEDRWAQYWVNEHLFDIPGSASSSSLPTIATQSAIPQKTFTMLLPPPNVTGRLHMGHMLNQTEMDILTRWHRMRGERANWVPGTDHAGIATQMMVERQLASEKTSRQALGRDAFIERVWQWKAHYGGAILDQMKRLGASVDWSREYFTMDDGLSAAVKEAFVRLHEQGLIYRGTYIVNWCPSCQTAVSDIEVVHEEQQGKLYVIRYNVVGPGDTLTGETITIATTRPETMPGDVAVAVHPDDERYAAFHGKSVVEPVTGRILPIVTDAWVSRDFGTGAVKITPAHDANDFELGKRHNLPQINVMDETAQMNAAAGAYACLDRFVARKQIIADLEARGQLVEIKEHTNSVGRCDRSRDIIEPRLSTQWFVKIQPLADKAIAAVEEGHIRFTPEQYKKTYFEWMRNIHDWCISRQLWWGHRIPAWHCDSCHGVTVARETPTKCSHCGSAALHQETDVLDTWFSSGLLPMSVFGWPQHTPDLDMYYPTQLLVTGFDILFFWVARMIMFGCHFMLDEPMADGSARTLADAVPFREVYIHALVRDADRQKMSKTKGNVIDPIDTIAKFGTDATRFTLASMASPGTDIAFNEERTEGYRAFANKIWNAARFLFMQVDRAAEAGIVVAPATLPAAPVATEHDTLDARWIVSRLNSTAASVHRALDDYRFDEAASVIYQFFWGDFCDWYLEIAKIRLDFSTDANADGKRAALTTLLGVFEAALRLLSPFMPFLTEELWHALYDGKPAQKSIALTHYPSAMAPLDAAAEAAMAQLQALIVALRDLRRAAGVPEKEGVPAQVKTSDTTAVLLRQNSDMLERLARVSHVTFVDGFAEGAVLRSTPEFDAAIVFEKQIDPVAERERLTKELARFEKEQANAERQLGNEAFLGKAPAAVVDGLRKRAAELQQLVPKTRAAIEGLR